MFRNLRKAISNNGYVLVGVLIGVYISSLLQYEDCQNDLTFNDTININEALNAVTNINALPKMNFTRKTTSSSKKAKLVRPRYYSTELGIREKLFVGVLTSEEKIYTHAIHLNNTIGHLIDKIKFFITAQYKSKNKLNLTGLVGFTDTRHKYRPFQVLKYIGDSFLQDYDYYFLINDYSYINIHKLKDLVNKISVSSNVYLGTAVPESSYCNLDVGMLLSNSVLKAVHEHLDWCVTNAVSDDHSENIGRCVYHSANIDCQEAVQGQHLSGYKIKHFVLEKHLNSLSNRQDFNNAVTVTPVFQSRDYYLLNAYFTKQRLVQLMLENQMLSKDLIESWPPGERVASKPLTRFDVPRQFFFNMTHVFHPDDFTNVMEHTKSDFNDIEKILEVVKQKVLLKESKNLQFRRLVNGYRKFDLSRGMDYLLDLGFRDLNTGKEVIKRFEVCKPLGKVEFIPVPYVTENARVAIFLPIQESEKDLAIDFIEYYSKTIMEQHEKTFLMLIFLYQYDSSSKGKNDIFGNVKNLTLKLSNRFHMEDTRIAWVSIRLPKINRLVKTEEYSVLNYAIIDLALKKVGLESLVLIVDVYSEFSVDFLNRVRMNTISNFQIFNAIPFRQYNPKITQIDALEVHKNIGHFDREEYKYIAFYAKDYINARKKSQHLIPIIKSDNDISKALLESGAEINIFEMFLKFSQNIHPMRATEMNLKVKYHDSETDKRKNCFYGNKVQLAKLILKMKQSTDLI